jgi:cytochrome P450 family 710 subfamily A protein
MDFWALRCLEEVAEAEAAGTKPPQHTSNHAMADTVMDFLFASQDASTASLVWLTCLLADRPHILAKVPILPDTPPPPGLKVPRHWASLQLH